MKEDLLLNGNAKSKIKGTLFIKFSCVAAYLILYMAIRQEVEIFRVVSGYRDLSALFTDADD
jgi:hypothetical protein